ncbi:uncharacterized protein CLUP02_03832 [Colletotrichum lupini]|uniref:Uncharacterized protein n=1 Tax=Colletotrichum lupini TaxID=145971 RepID=A0A9Q8SK26_9PEZI|nr:uncharacterized protein CLUP02_03832 [Colletotrichum lupini]UQC78355.1 hypothetical protein CLUP02_03832 [Colletotrichum lupini]
MPQDVQARYHSGSMCRRGRILAVTMALALRHVLLRPTSADEVHVTNCCRVGPSVASVEISPFHLPATSSPDSFPSTPKYHTFPYATHSGPQTSTQTPSIARPAHPEKKEFEKNTEAHFPSHRSHTLTFTYRLFLLPFSAPTLLFLHLTSPRPTSLLSPGLQLFTSSTSSPHQLFQNNSSHDRLFNSSTPTLNLSPTPERLYLSPIYSSTPPFLNFPDPPPTSIHHLILPATHYATTHPSPQTSCTNALQPTNLYRPKLPLYGFNSLTTFLIKSSGKYYSKLQHTKLPPRAIITPTLNVQELLASIRPLYQDGSGSGIADPENRHALYGIKNPDYQSYVPRPRFGGSVDSPVHLHASSGGEVDVPALDYRENHNFYKI